jgi:hypothetical protein
MFREAQRQATEKAREILGEEEFEKAWTRGLKMQMEEAAEWASAVLHSP